MLKVMAATLVALVIGMVVGPRFIRWLQRRGIGQNIRELTPESHSAKQGTPTMGGVLILVAALIPYLIFATKTVPSLVVFILAFGSGAIGFADDLISQWRQRSLGLSARIKLLLQVPLVGVGRVPRAPLRRGRHEADACPSSGRAWTSAGSTTSSPSSSSPASPTPSTSPTAWTGWRRGPSRWPCSPTPGIAFLQGRPTWPCWLPA